MGNYAATAATLEALLLELPFSDKDLGTILSGCIGRDPSLVDFLISPDRKKRPAITSEPLRACMLKSKNKHQAVFVKLLAIAAEAGVVIDKVGPSVSIALEC